ncbi:hypothetical protein F5B20DRAFT_207015 [Whalleya microplaca]|nr:hypothetical protein F5B20DRAFT_207015 [Whalleya microplaca]
MHPSQQRNGNCPLIGELWQPDLPHHFVQPGAVSSDGTLGFIPGQGMQQPETLQGLNNLASAAAISNPYNYPQPPISGERPPSSGGPSAFLGNGDIAIEPSSATAHHKEQQRARRRVPPSQRKRTQVSCDACKTRRCKCVRPRSGFAFAGDPQKQGTVLPCKSCTEGGIPCVTTMPRKQRVYGSVENLDKRYRALEALVQGVFPNLNPRASAEELVAFGRERAILMPEFSEQSDYVPSADPLIKTEDMEPARGKTSSPQQEGTMVVSGTELERTILPPAYSAGGMSTMSTQLLPQPPEGLSNRGFQSTGLITDAGGRPHYIGPCGSLKFFASMRDLVSNLSRETRDQNDDEQRKRSADIEKGTAQKFIRNTLANSLAGSEGDEVRTFTVERRCPSFPRVGYLEGDAPPRISQELLKKFPDDPDYWRYRRPTSEIELPPRERADACVNAFFCEVHPNFILFHQITFRRAYETLWFSYEAHRDGIDDENLKEVSVSVGWLVCLYMIFIFGSRSLPQTQESIKFQRKWLAKVDLLPPLLSTSSLLNVCAYMLLSLYHHNTNDRTSAWTFHGAGCRLAIALGMHRESVSSSFDPLERALRKQIWWTMYSYEQFLCCSLGRPSAIDDREVDVGISKDDFLEGNTLAPGHCEHSTRLSMLLAAVRRGIFNPSFIPERMYDRALEFLEPLAAWEDNIPKSLKPVCAKDNPNPKQWRITVLLQVRYQNTLAFATRPFLLKIVESGAGGEPLGPDAAKIKGLGQVCLTASMRSSDLLIGMWRAGCINGITWIDIYYAHLANMVIMLALTSPDSLLKGDTSSKIIKAQLIQKFTTQDMRDQVRELCRMMTSVEMCGTNARFAKVSTQFATALGITGKGADASHRSSLSGSKMIAGEEDLSNETLKEKMKSEQDSLENFRQNTETDGEDQTMTGISNYSLSDMNLELPGSVPRDVNGGMGGDVQWDM